MNFDRKAAVQVREALDDSPVAGILGPRQCGKTTLAKMLLQGRPDSLYLDMERPDDLRALSDPQAFFRLHRGRTICLDEIQRIPQIFPVIRAEVDEAEMSGRFLILGSASPDLLRQTSESLAGRIRYIYLTPFAIDEVPDGKTALRSLWLRGGFPRSYLAKTDEASFEWREDFVQTFLERDIPSMGFRMPSGSIRRFWTMLTHLNGQVLNRSKLGESLGLSHHTVQHYLDILVDSFMVRSLPPFEANLRKRLVKSPKIYFRDSGILHVLGGIRTQRHLLTHPDYGRSWESFALENICGDLRINRHWRFFFYAAHSGGEIDLILENGRDRIAVEFKASSAPDVPSRLQTAMADIEIERAWIVAPVNRLYPHSDAITVGTPTDFVTSIV